MNQYSNRLGIPPVVLNLIIINFIVYILTGYLMPNLLNYIALYYPIHGGFFQPYQLVTYMFAHGGFWHIAFNMFALWMFGSQIEMIWGGKKFLFFYLICGLGAAGFNIGIDYIKVNHFMQMLNDSQISQQEYFSYINPIVGSSMVGASGAIFGLLAAYGMMFPNQMLMMLFPPIPMKAKYFVIMYAALELYAGVSANPDDPIAHFAHLGGGLTGIILLLYWRQRGELYKWFK